MQASDLHKPIADHPLRHSFAVLVQHARLELHPFTLPVPVRIVIQHDQSSAKPRCSLKNTSLKVVSDSSIDWDQRLDSRPILSALSLQRIWTSTTPPKGRRFWVWNLIGRYAFQRHTTSARMMFKDSTAPAFFIVLFRCRVRHL